MSLLNYMSHISLAGPMKRVVRVLDAVKKNLGTDDVFDRYIALPDLLDEECMQDSLLQEKKRRFDELGFKQFMLECRKGENDDEEYLAYLEDSIEEYYSNGRMIAIVGTAETDKGFEIEFELLEEENCPVYADWLDWGDIARVYGCTVFEDVELFRNGSFESYKGTGVYEPRDGAVKETHISPEHNLEAYVHKFDRLIDINPERYRPLKIRYFEDLIRRMRNEVNRERVRVVRDNLKANGGRAVIPDGITFIPGWIFTGCDELVSIYIPESVSEFGICLFDRSGLASIEVAADNPHFSSRGNCLLDKEGKTLLFGCKTSVIPEGVEVIAEYAFHECFGLTEIALPDSVRTIGNQAFSGCSNLVDITLDEGLAEIGGSAFQRCTSLDHIAIPDSVTTIYAQAFDGCSSLAEVTLPKNNIKIYDFAFRDCPCEEDLDVRYAGFIPKGETRKEEPEEPAMGFNELIDADGDATIPDGTTEIEECAFEDCRNLLTVDIPASVKVIDFGAFCGCTNLVAVMIREGLEEIRECAFKGCTSLEYVKLPESLKSVSYDAFMGCPCEDEVMKECEKRSIIS